MWLFSNRRPEESPWAECYGGAYISWYREEFDTLLAKLASRFGNLKYRFVATSKRVEFYEPDGELAAHVSVEGECCQPCIAIVSIVTLPAEARLLFKEAFPGLYVRFA